MNPRGSLVLPPPQERMWNFDSRSGAGDSQMSALGQKQTIALPRVLPLFIRKQTCLKTRLLPSDVHGRCPL
jgi:hypothetical protein